MVIFFRYRYPTLNIHSVTSIQVQGLVDTDDPESLKIMSMQSAAVDVPKTKRRKKGIYCKSTGGWCNNIIIIEILKMTLVMSNFNFAETFMEPQVHADTLLDWLRRQVALYSVTIDNMDVSFKNGLALCAIIHRYRPDLMNFHELRLEEVAKNNQLAFEVLEKEYTIPPVCLLFCLLLFCSYFAIKNAL